MGFTAIWSMRCRNLKKELRTAQEW